MRDPYINSCLALASHQSGEMRKLINKIFLAYGTRSGLIQKSLTRPTTTFEQAQCPTFSRELIIQFTAEQHHPAVYSLYRT